MVRTKKTNKGEEKKRKPKAKPTKRHSSNSQKSKTSKTHVKKPHKRNGKQNAKRNAKRKNAKRTNHRRRGKSSYELVPKYPEFAKQYKHKHVEMTLPHVEWLLVDEKTRGTGKGAKQGEIHIFTTPYRYVVENHEPPVQLSMQTKSFSIAEAMVAIGTLVALVVFSTFIRDYAAKNLGIVVSPATNIVLTGSVLCTMLFSWGLFTTFTNRAIFAVAATLMIVAIYVGIFVENGSDTSKTKSVSIEGAIKSDEQRKRVIDACGITSIAIIALIVAMGTSSNPPDFTIALAASVPFWMLVASLVYRYAGKLSVELILRKLLDDMKAAGLTYNDMKLIMFWFFMCLGEISSIGYRTLNLAMMKYSLCIIASSLLSFAGFLVLQSPTPSV